MFTWVASTLKFSAYIRNSFIISGKKMMDDDFNDEASMFSPETLETLGIEDWTVQRDYGRERGQLT